MTASSETLLDLILISDISKILKVGSFDPAISDHKLVYSVVKLTRKREQQILETVKLALQNTPWWISNLFEDLGLVHTETFFCVFVLFIVLKGIKNNQFIT